MNELNSRRTASCVIEQVEARRLLATLSVDGNSSNDNVVIQVSDGQISVTLNGSTQSYPDDDYSEINVNLLEGDDTAEVVSNGDNAVSVWGGSGGDTLRVGTSSQFAEAYFASGDGTDNIYVNQDSSGSAVGRLLLEAGSKVERLSLIDVRASGLYEIPKDIGYATLETDDEEVSGAVDLNDNSWILKDGPAGTPSIDIARSMITQGYAIGEWNGSENAIRSSICYGTPIADGIGYAYASQTPRTSLNGIGISGSDLLMAYTLCGDVNFDFTVGFSDLLTVAQGYGTSGDRSWYQGDSNYDDTIDFNDLISVAQNYGNTVANAPAAKPGIVTNVPYASRMFVNLFSNQTRIVDVVG